MRQFKLHPLRRDIVGDRLPPAQRQVPVNWNARAQSIPASSTSDRQSRSFKTRKSDFGDWTDIALHLPSLIDYLHEELVGAAHKMLASSGLQKSDREDLIQEAWVKLLKRYSCGTYTAGDIGNLWKTIVRTTLIDGVRKRLRRREPATPQFDVIDFDDAHDEDTSETLAIQMAKIDTAKSKLTPQKHRFVTIWLSVTEQSLHGDSRRGEKRGATGAPRFSLRSVIDSAVGEYNSTLQRGDKPISLPTAYRWVREFRNTLVAAPAERRAAPHEEQPKSSTETAKGRTSRPPSSREFKDFPEVAVKTSSLREIRVGRVIYPLKKEIVGDYRFETDRYSIRPNVNFIHDVATGRTSEEALANWCANVHVAIQRLLAIPEPNRTEEETNLWNSLAEFIDFQAYEESRPIKTVRRGVVLSAWPKDWQVQWEDDDSVECVSVVVVPEDFVRLHEGDHFEATADVHPIDGTLMYVHEVRPVEPYEDLLPEDAEAYWESLRQTEDLAESGHDWTQP